MRTLSAAEFRNSCLAVLEQVERTREPITVTRHGKPVACITPVSSRAAANPLIGSIEHQGDLIGPLDDDWDALR